MTKINEKSWIDAFQINWVTYQRIKNGYCWWSDQINVTVIVHCKCQKYNWSLTWYYPLSVECEAGQYKNSTMISCSKCPDGTEAYVTKTGCG